MRVTQKDIARALNVSLITVHRALNNCGYVSKSLKEKILNHAKKVNYVPHKASQVLVRNKTRKIAIFSSDEPNYFWNDVRTGIDIASQQILPFDYQVQYHMIPGNDSDFYLEKLREAINDGVEATAIVNQWVYDMKDIIHYIDRQKIPYITLNIDAPESKRMCFIGPDYPAGGRLAAEFIGKSLMSKKRAHVLVINKKAEATADSNAPDINRQRLEGFLSVMQKEFDNIQCEIGFIMQGIHSDLIESEIEEIITSTEGDINAIYLIPTFNKQFVKVIDKLGFGREMIIVIHDLDLYTNHYFEKNWITAVIYQNPILQGYYAVKILENILESGRSPDKDHISIVHSLILNENKDLYRNHYLFTKMIDGIKTKGNGG